MSVGTKLEVGFHSWSFASLRLEEALKRISDAGFAEVEINANSKRHLNPRFFPRGELPHLRRLLEDLSLHPNSVHAPFSELDLSTPRSDLRRQTVDLLADTLEYCRAIGCPIMVVHPNHTDSLPIGPEAMKRNSVEALRELANRAEDLGVKIALENMIDKEGGRFGSRVADLRKIIEEAGSPLMGICLDTGHTNLLPGSNVSQEEEIAQTGELLWTLHIDDNDGREDRHWLPGEGNIDWNQIIKGLRRANYQGVFMMEIQERTDPDELARRSLQRATEILSIQ